MGQIGGRYFRISALLSAVLIVGGVIGFELKKDEFPMTPRIRIAISKKFSKSDIDNRKIIEANQYVLFKSLFSTLVTQDESGQLKPGIASEFEINENKVVFRFGKKRLSSKGDLIDAEDAKISLIRQLRADTNSHGFLKSLLKRNGHSGSFGDSIKVSPDGKELTVLVKKASYAKFLPSLFTSVDFAIIPKKSLDSDGGLIDLQNTSGAYFLLEDEKNLVFRINPHYFELTGREVPEIEFLVVERGQDPVSLLENGKIDAIGTLVFIDPDQVIGKNGMNLFETEPFRLKAVKFSYQAQKRIPLEQRLYFAVKLREAHLKAFPPTEKYRETVSFFPDMAAGGLTEMQQSEISEMYRSTSKPEHNVPLTVGVGEAAKKVYSQIFANDDFVRYEEFNLEKALPETSAIDALLVDTDTVFNESISMISYNISMGNFGMTREEGEGWLENYMETEDQKERIAMLRDLHFRVLKEGRIVPVRQAPYFVVTRKGLQYEGSRFSASTDFWKIRVPE